MDMNAKASHSFVTLEYQSTRAGSRPQVGRAPFSPPCVPNADKKAGRTMRPRKEYGGIP